MLRLTKEQVKHYDSIFWLFDSNDMRKVGRSTLLAKILIDLAIKYPKRRIHIKDLTTIPIIGDSHQINRIFIEDILLPILKDYPNIQYNESQMTIVYKPN